MFDRLFKATVGIATTPVNVIADVVTMGGALSDRDESYTAKGLRDVMENLDKATDPDED